MDEPLNILRGNTDRVASWIAHVQPANAVAHLVVADHLQAGAIWPGSQTVIHVGRVPQLHADAVGVGDLDELRFRRVLDGACLY